MRDKILLTLIVVLFAFSCKKENKNTIDYKTDHDEKPRFTYILDMVHDNPGEAPTESKYTKPSYIREMGANGMIPHLHIQTAIDYASFDSTLFNNYPKQAKWIAEKKDWINKKLREAEEQNIDIYPFTDFMVLPSILLDNYRNELVRDEYLKKEEEGQAPFTAIKGKNAPDINKPLVEKLTRIQINEIFETFPSVDGLTVRFGETYLFDTPYHSGGSPLARGGDQGINDHIKLINILREEVCIKRNKKIFYRTWDFGFFHEKPDVFEKIVSQVKPHKNLIFSIKHQQGDFQRMTPFNPTLGIGNHPYIVEVCCQLDSYGKGAHPYYNGLGVIEGWEEYEKIMKEGENKGIQDLLPDPNFVGVWTWSRGGGWQGPYIENELWIDLNTQVISRWAQNPDKTEEQVFNDYAASLGLEGENIAKFRRIALLSAAGGLRGHSSLYATGKEDDLTPWWTRDHFMYGQEMIRPFLERMIKEDKVEAVLQEKKEAVEMWREIEQLSQEIKWENLTNKEYLKISATYGRIKYEIFENAWTVLLLGMGGEKTGDFDKERIQKAITRYDELWKEWKELKENNPQSATLYYPHAFAIGYEGVYADKENGMDASINKYRNLLNVSH